MQEGIEILGTCKKLPAAGSSKLPTMIIAKPALQLWGRMLFFSTIYVGKPFMISRMLPHASL
jgi:hypothetical protein